MTSSVAPCESKNNQKQPVFEELNADKDPEVTEIESLCLNCHHNGVTKLLLTKIPFYKEVVVMSFFCKYCLWKNNELKPASNIQEKGISYSLNVENSRDLARVVVKTEWACVMIPELDFEAPSRSQEGRVTTVEGIIERAHNGLSYQIGRLKVQGDESAEKKLTEFTQKLVNLKKGETPFTFVLRDCTGNSFLENLCAPAPDPQLKISHFERSREESLMLGIYSLDLTDDEKEEDSSEEENSELADEVLGLPTNCYACNAPCVTNMKLTHIPHFKDVVIMATTCDACGHKTNEVKTSSGIESLGIKITLHVEKPEDLKRDVLKSDTCSICVKELELEVGAAAFGSRYTTVEGIFASIKEQLKESNPFFVGDSADPLLKEKMDSFFKKIDEVISGEKQATLVLDDPCGNSYLQSICYPEPDKNLIVERYERSEEQNEELGLLDMKVENYEES